MKLKASIIIIHFSNVDYTTNCIKSALQAKSLYEYEILIIDNARKEDDLAVLKKRFHNNQRVIIYSNTSNNTGFSSGILTGLHNAKNDYLVILDNDTLVSDYWLDGLLDCFKNNIKTGIATAQILSSDSPHKSILGGKMNIFGFSYSNTIQKDDLSQKDDRTIFYGITAWAIKKSLLEKVTVDTHFQFFSDDADIGYKIKSLGYTIAPAITSKVTHLKSNKDKAMNQKTINYKVKICNRDYWVFSYLHLPPAHFSLFFLMLFLFKICFLPLRILRRDKSIPYDIAGFLSFVSMLDELREKRHKRQQIRSISHLNLIKHYTKKLYVGTMIFK